MTLIDLFCNK